MYFVLERTKKILQELKKYIHENSVSIDTFMMKEGNFRGLQEVESCSKEWQTYKTGTRWGGKDCHAWFRTSFTVPETFNDQKVALNIVTGQTGWDATNPQFIIYINGEIVQGADVNHHEIIIDRCAKAGKVYQLDIHAYSGLNDSKSDLLVYFATIEEKVKNLYYDISVPLSIAEKLDDNDKNRLDIANILNETINLIDARKPKSKDFYQSICCANNFIEEEFYKKLCGHEDIVATCVGHTHIDVAWWWTIAQTREKVGRSFSTVLNLMEDYPEYVFMSSQPQLYKFIKQDYPEIYEKIKVKVQEGKWEPEGAMWVEADCNLPSGESLVRQVMFGTRFFEQEFGVKNEILWLPDVFGYSAALPQILKKSDIKYFMTTKIAWNQFNKIPNDTFMWEGIDGTEILTHFITTKEYEAQPQNHFTTYNGDINASQVMGAWQRYQQKHINNDVLVSFGYGDGGGGPTMEMLENAKRMEKGIPGCPKVQIKKSKDYFDKLSDKVSDNRHLPKWVGELYLEYHRGTYTSMARNKRYNRKSEFLYQDLEFVSSLNKMLGKEYPQQMINEGWETILLNQFHDIIPGSSIYEVYEDSKEQYEQLISKGQDLLNGALNSVANAIQIDNCSVVVFNTLSFKRDDIVYFDLPDTMNHILVKDEDKQLVPSQIIEKDGIEKLLIFAKDIPSKGYKTFVLEEASQNNEENAIKISSDKLENKYFTIEIDSKGTFSSIYDKVNKRQVLKENEKGNKILAFEDKPMDYDNWDIDIFYQEKMWEVDEVEKIEVIEQGPVRGCVRVYKKFLDSKIIQDIYIYSDIPRIDFDTYVDWKEDQILLKTAFPVDVHTDKATYEIQFGNVERATHWNTSWDTAKFEVCAHKWADLSEDKFGVSLLNDCKYGHDIKDSNMRLTLLKSGIEPNDKADREEHRFIYSLYPHEGDWKDAKTTQMAYCLNVPLYAKVKEPQKGTLPSILSLMAVNADNVIIDTVKKAEDSDDIIIRVYECYNRRTNATLSFPTTLQDVTECNLMEKTLTPMCFNEKSFAFEIKPYEIKTFKVKMKI